MLYKVKVRSQRCLSGCSGPLGDSVVLSIVAGIQSAVKKSIPGMVLCFAKQMVCGSIHPRARKASKFLYMNQFYNFFRTRGLSFKVA